MKEFVCICCPRGCRLTVEGERVTGNLCPRGRDYGIAECYHPVRTVTTTVRVVGRPWERVSVKTALPVEKSKIFDITKLIHSAAVRTPVRIGDVILRDVGGTDVVATSELL